MIGDQTTGRLSGVCITAASHTGLLATVNGKPARLAIITDDGQVIAAGNDVAREAEAVAVQAYRNTMKAQGHMVVTSKPLTQGVQHG
jgi:hypothetical protein